jgi:hypothetical protein
MLRYSTVINRRAPQFESGAFLAAVHLIENGNVLITEKFL